MKKLGLLLAAAAMVAFAGSAMAAPAAQATWAMGDLIALGSAEADADVGTPADSDDTGWVTVLKTFIKTPNKKELAFDMALQCGLVTQTEVKSKGGNKGTSNAEGTIRVRIKVTDDEGAERFALPNEGDSSDLGVTYCNRFQQLEGTFAGLDCTADLTTGAVTCENPESMNLILETLTANAFNVLLIDVGSGTNKIEVQARARASANVFTDGSEDEDFGTAHAEAFVGLGSLDVRIIRLVKDADTTTLQ